MYVMGRKKSVQAFALPTILIASVVLLSVLAVSVTATAAIRTTLKNQYYVQLAQTAGESGVAFAKACLAANGNVPQWTDAKPLTPATDCSGNAILSPTVKALVVGGGGGGANTGAGGGAGGYQYSDSLAVAAGSFPVTVGAGGAGGSGGPTKGIKGSNSMFMSLTAEGGGGGATHGNGSTEAGGSGGGGAIATAGVAPVGGAGTQGNKGGDGFINSGWNGGSGGGGGAGSAGVAGSGTGGGNGGSGIMNTITGSQQFYAAGGGGGEVYASVVGTGGSSIGGSAQVDNVGTNGTANTGSGGGGGSFSGSYPNGGSGGSGVVIISYPVNSGIVATGTLTPSNVAVTPTTSGGNRIFKFTGSGTFTVTSAGTATCPSDPRCSVTVKGNIRSSFSVPKPIVDPTTGQALTIPNSGYTEVTRSSAPYDVWRTYKQPSVQAAVVPDLCSGNATAARGWNAAVKVSSQDALPSASTAQTISIADTAVNPGVMYFRKDFNVSVGGLYDLNVYTSSTQDSAVTYIDGLPISTAAGSVATAQTNLQPGCHVLVTKLTNQAYLPRVSDFTASLTRPGAATPLVVSDPTWRVTAGDSAHFATSNYFEAPTAWEPVFDFGIWSNAALPWGTAAASWPSVSGDSLAEWISTSFSSGGVARPGAAYAWFRSSQPFVTNTDKTVRVTTYCDNKCELYLDGNLVMSPALDSGVVSKSINVPAGTHTFGVRLFNAGPSANAAAFLFAAVDITTPSAYVVLDRSSPGWNATTSWSTSAATDPSSYDALYVPVPTVQKSANAKVLVVGGGGGGGSDMGGGGGGGGVVSNAAYPLSVGSYAVTVGGGGTGAPAGIGQARGGNGGNSVFGTLRAIGGGGGGSEYSTNTSPPGAGGSAGGVAGCNQQNLAAPVIGQGYASAPTIGCYYPSGGGGAGGLGMTNPGTGGPGVANNILGTNYYWGGGGGGSGYTGNGGNGGIGGGGGGAVGTTTGGAGINPGSPGGGGVVAAQTNKPGGNGGIVTGGGGGGGSHYNATNYGGNGGSGTVIVSFPTTSMSATATGSFNNFSSSTPGFTTYLFYGPGTFVVNSIN